MPKKGGAIRQVGCKSLVEPILLQWFLQGFVSSCKDGVHYRLRVKLLGWSRQLQENGYFSFEVAGTNHQPRKGATCE